MKRNRNNGFLKRIRRKYRVSIVNEFTLEEAFHFQISRPLFYAALFLFIALLFVLFSVLYLHTPLKKYSPGYSDMIVRSELVMETMRLDSIRRDFETQKKQMNIIKGILSGEIVMDSSFSISDKDIELLNTTFIEKSEQEDLYCEEYEEREKYNLSSIEEKKAEYAPVFFKPVRGVITREFNPQDKHFGCDIVASPNETVVSIYNGVIIFAEYTTNADFVIGILHENNYISIYKHNAQLMKKIGDEVKTGEVIAIVSASGNEDNTKPYLHFELWQGGKPLNPSEYIIF